MRALIFISILVSSTVSVGASVWTIRTNLDTLDQVKQKEEEFNRKWQESEVSSAYKVGAMFETVCHHPTFEKYTQATEVCRKHDAKTRPNKS